MSESSISATANATLSRRQWLSRLPLPAAAALASTAFASPLAAQATASSDADLGARIYNIRTFGAKGDGKTLDTAALQSAIDACHRDHGGTVLVPAGTFLIGATELRSNVTLHLAAGATLLGAADGHQYHAVDAIPLTGDSTLGDGNWALLFAVDATNLTIEGAGTIDGQGFQFHSPVRGTPPPAGISGNKRPYHILLHRCKRVFLRDIALVDCAYHSVRIIQSEQVHIDGLYIHNRVNGNNDGFHFISVQHLTLSNCTILSQDDACALFGSCRNISITNSFFSTRWSVFRFGGGTAENITVSNCVLSQVFGCPFKFHGTPGSRFERISFSDIVLDQVTGPIHLSLGPENRGKAQSEELPAKTGAAPAIARHISFSNIQGTVTTDPPQLPEARVSNSSNPGERHSAIALNAVGGAIIEHISFSNIHLTFGGGGTLEDGARRELPVIAGEYFALGPLPAFGFYARNARAITLQNVRLQTASPDLRPAVVLDHVDDISILALTVQPDAKAESALRFQNVTDALLTATRVLTPVTEFLRVEGATSAGIHIDGGDLRKAATAITTKEGARADSVTTRV